MVKDKENKVYKLVKSLYGLKQAPKQWHDKFGSIMTFDGYVIYESILFFFFNKGRGRGNESNMRHTGDNH